MIHLIAKKGMPSRFDSLTRNVEVREYEVVASDNPSVKSGVALEQVRVHTAAQ